MINPKFAFNQESLISEIKHGTAALNEENSRTRSLAIKLGVVSGASLDVASPRDPTL